MINKRSDSPAAAVADIFDGAVIMVGGFGEAGSPTELIHALVDRGTKNLTLINNNAGCGRIGLASLIVNGQVRKMICSFPRSTNSTVFADAYRRGQIELELVPQGTLAERIRAGGAGIPAFYTATAVGTPLAEGKESRRFGEREYLLEHGLRADFAFVKAEKADRYGNLVYRNTARNFGPIMCMAANISIIQTRQILDAGALDPESIVTPGIFVKRIVLVPNPVQESQLLLEGRSYP